MEQLVNTRQSFFDRPRTRYLIQHDRGDEPDRILHHHLEL
jgi:hypothetical protein